MKLKLLLIFLVVHSVVDAQTLLTVDDAVSIALKNNYDILVARNDADIAKVNNTPGNAGMLPEVQLSGSGNYELNTIHQQLNNGGENNYSGHPTSAFNAGTELSWTLFDGGKMFVAKDKLDEIEALGGIQFKSQVLQTMYDVISAYYDVVRQKQELNSINEAMNYNHERVTIAQAGFNAGSMLKTDLLQAKIDLNVAMEAAINQEVVIDAAIKTLNTLLGQKPETTFEVSDSIPAVFTPDKDELLKKVNESNTGILTYRKQLDIARLDLKSWQKSYSPVFKLQGGILPVR